MAILHLNPDELAEKYKVTNEVFIPASGSYYMDRFHTCFFASFR